MGDMHYAHSLPSRPQGEWQPLETHLLNVARRTAEFAGVFDSEAHGYLAGLWHDLGKYLHRFQERLRGNPVRVDHAAIGAALALRRDRERGLPLAFAIVGHHAGLPNLKTNVSDLPTPLVERATDGQRALEEVLRNVPREIAEQPMPDLPPGLKMEGVEQDQEARIRRMEFWTRFLYSALIDADRLDSEAFDQTEKSLLRGRYDSLATLSERLDRYIQDKVDSLTDADRSRRVNQVRAEVLDHCRTAAERGPGFFSITVPTGGAKTLCGMSFALRHALAYGLRRVIVVIPFTSIIEQNAGEYRQALGNANVIEHHSNLDTEEFRKECGRDTLEKHQLAAENWDAPIIVTTTVQFFESLFSNKPSRCRKLHNTARSVILLDEVQTLPPGFLSSILDALKELVARYGCSVVLSTATPPALVARERFADGISHAYAVIPDPSRLYTSLKRVEYSWPDPDGPPVEWPDLARQLAQHRQVLAVLHRRADARVLAGELQALTDKRHIYHLSALMCAAHRTKMLERIRAQLRDEAPCRVVATQLVEAGVDIDFPVVYRALGGLDSIVQAAGRCNREGRMETGTITVFRAPSKPPVGTPRKALAVTESLLRERGALDTANPALFEEYFRRLYLVEDRDVHHIQTERQQLNFATVGSAFRLIEDGFTRTVVVPYADAEERLAKLRLLGSSRERLRGLQAFTVSVYQDTFSRWVRDGVLEEVVPSIWTLSSPYAHLYTEDFGLQDEGEAVADPAGLMV